MACVARELVLGVRAPVNADICTELWYEQGLRDELLNLPGPFMIHDELTCYYILDTR